MRRRTAADLNIEPTTAALTLRTIDGMIRGDSDRRPRAIDALGVAVVIAAVILGTANIPGEPGDRDVDMLAFACGVVGAVALLFWRRWILAVVLVVAVATAVYVARGYPGGPALLPGPLALLAIGYAAPRRVGWFGVAAYLTLATISRVLFGHVEWLELLVIAGWSSAAVLAGQLVATRGERAAAERERQAHVREQARAAERLHIAQDLHDSVAHAMATINVQSGVAAHLIDRDAGQVKRALEAIRVASRDALDELGSILNVLREPGGSAPLAPTARLADVGELVERARADGLPVAVTVTGDPSRVTPSVGAAAYRVVQEALTNVRRHAGPAAKATVTVAVGARGDVRVQVDDDGDTAAARSASTGFGLVGMRERVESTGGALRAGPKEPLGFSVLATWNARP